MSCEYCRKHDRKKYPDGQAGANVVADIKNGVLRVINIEKGGLGCEECYVKITHCPWCGEKL